MVMGHTLTLFGFLFENCDTFRQIVVSSTGPPDLHHYSLLPSGMLPSGMLPSGMCLRVCAFGFVAYSIASEVGRYESHG